MLSSKNIKNKLKTVIKDNKMTLENKFDKLESKKEVKKIAIKPMQK